MCAEERGRFVTKRDKRTEKDRSNPLDHLTHEFGSVVDADHEAVDNLFGYLAHEFEGFDERPLTDVDSLVLSCLSYYRLPDEARAARTHEGMPLHELFRADWFDQMTRGLWDPAGLVRLLACAVASPRFRDLRVSDYAEDFDDESEKQFAAVTLRLPSGGAYVSFRGTDNTIVGWKEDFNMVFRTGVPAQRAALAYLEEVGPTVEGELFLGGHSKGGNLAVYALSRCSDELAARVTRTFSHDGPGFTDEAFVGTAWGDRKCLISKTVPRSSLIGMLFEHEGGYAVVSSSMTGIMQHDPFSWIVEGDAFVYEEGLGRGAVFIDRGLNEWVSSMPTDQREEVVDLLFSVLYASGKDTFADLSENWQTTIPAMLEKLGSLETEQRSRITGALSLLVRAFLPDVDLSQLLSRFSPMVALTGRRDNEDESA